MKKELFIVDDDQVFRLIVSKMIKYRDATVGICECENGEIGLAELKKRENAAHKMIVLLDINMPVVDGWTFLEEIEKNGFYNLPQLDIYMVTSSVDESDIEKVKQYTFVKGLYHKPLKSEDIVLFIGSE